MCSIPLYKRQWHVARASHLFSQRRECPPLNFPPILSRWIVFNFLCYSSPSFKTHGIAGPTIDHLHRLFHQDCKHIITSNLVSGFTSTGVKSFSLIMRCVGKAFKWNISCVGIRTIFYLIFLHVFLIRFRVYYSSFPISPFLLSYAPPPYYRVPPSSPFTRRLDYWETVIRSYGTQRPPAECFLHDSLGSALVIFLMCRFSLFLYIFRLFTFDSTRYALSTQRSLMERAMWFSRQRGDTYNVRCILHQFITDVRSTTDVALLTNRLPALQYIRFICDLRMRFD